MKKLLLFVLLISKISFAQDLDVMTYNIRYATETDGVNSWENRKESMVLFLKDKTPVIIGTQEGLNHQLTYLGEHLKRYAFTGDARDDGKTKGEYSAIFYDTTRVKLIETHTVWLCESTDKDTIGWDAAMKRVCTYALFADIENANEFWVFNAHFDHVGVKARAESAKLVSKLNLTENQPPRPVVVMGDFNSEPDSEAIQNFKIMFSDALDLAEEKQEEPLGTFTGFNPKAKLDKRIDWIFVQGFNVQSYRHFTDKRADGNFISDHLPVMAKLRFK